MEFFVAKESIVRKIWGKSDTILFIFAGASAEFALNKSVDWLYYTGKLPADPLGRLFSTVMYARSIVFSPEPDALAAIDRITAIHNNVEESRNSLIPDWAYRDVLFMLIHYSITSFELLERPLTAAERDDLFQVFYRMACRMNLSGLPADVASWKIMHEQQLSQDLEKSHFSVDLYKQYRLHLGPFRFWLLKESQKLVCPKQVVSLLGFNRINWLKPILGIYRISRFFKLDRLIKVLLLPPAYQARIAGLDKLPSY